MMQPTPDRTDRRAFFRINDQVILNFRTITTLEAQELGEMIISSPTTSAHHLQPHSSVQTVFQKLLDQIGHRDREIARAIRLLDDKLNSLANNLQAIQNPIDDSSAVKVNLSAGGLAFMSDRDIESKTTVELRLQLLPSGLPIHALSKVVSCSHIGSDDGKNPYFLRLVFTHMSETDRNLLVKHTLSRQAESLRSHKHQND